MRYLWPLLFLALTQCSAWQGAADRSPNAKKQVLDKSGYLYDPTDTSCDGFPRLQVDTMPGTCLGLVLPRERAIDATTKKPLVMPRTIVALPGGTDFLLADMGGWKDNNGGLYLLTKNKGRYEARLVLGGLNKPHGLAVGQDNKIYLGESHRIIRFDFAGGKAQNQELVFGKLPRFKGHMHPLTQFTFDLRNGDLYINSGAPSDHCYVKEGDGGYKSCPEDVTQGLGRIYRISGAQLKQLPADGVAAVEHAAMGLRNSMAMVVHPSGHLIQGENSRDFPELEEPYEEINVVDLSKPLFHYGWPYCYDYHAVSPEWRFPENSLDPIRQYHLKPVLCATKEAKKEGDYQAPHALMPPHVAPLHMAYYGGGMLADLLGGQLLVSWHGYQPTGHRFVAYPVDEAGRPRLANPGSAAAKNPAYSFNVKNACPATRPFAPAGGAPRYAPYTEVISQWDARAGVRPKGAPVGFTVAGDGSIWIVEDRENRTVVRLARSTNGPLSSSCELDNKTLPDPRIELLAWRNMLATNPAARAGYENVKTKLTVKYCAGCHGDFREKDIADDQFSQLDYLVKNGWLTPGAPMHSKLYGAIAQTGEVPPMPPGGSAQFFGTAEGNEILKTVADWISALPTDMEARVRRVQLKEARKVRVAPGAAAKVCGQFDAGSTLYYDARPAAEVKKDGWVWSRTYVVPGDSRLYKQGCPYPSDGVFYVATRKLP